jgi:diguanylate cyclase (GGDEF)-like protein
MDAHKCSLLVVDDEPFILATLSQLLADEFEVLTADSADAAEAIFGQRPIDLLLTDQKMPRRSGVHLLEWVREHHPRTIRLLMTGFTELDDAIAAINRGQVYYYLHKPWRNEELLHILRNAADKFTLERNQDHLVEELRRLNVELESRVLQRTRELEEANQQLEQRTRELEILALTDPLTGLYNRRAIEDLAKFELKRHSRYPSPLALGLLDLDHFKSINKEYLLTGGDAVLQELARILRSSVREVDSVGRVGGEEFLVVARDTTEEGATHLAERIRTTVANTPISYAGNAISITASIGFAVAEVGVPTDYESLYKLAAEAEQHAKDTGRNRCVVRRVGPSAA